MPANSIIAERVVGANDFLGIRMGMLLQKPHKFLLPELRGHLKDAQANSGVTTAYEQLIAHLQTLAVDEPLDHMLEDVLSGGPGEVGATVSCRARKMKPMTRKMKPMTRQMIGWKKLLQERQSQRLRQMAPTPQRARRHPW